MTDRLQSGEPSLVDIHCHVLPGLDDGPPTLDAALAMLEIAQADGIGTIVATPHAERASADEIQVAVDGLNRAAADQGLSVRVLVGSELRLAADLPRRLAAGELLPLNGTPYVLLELPLGDDWPPFLAAAIYDLQVEGYLPILAHTERYPRVQREPTVLEPLIDAGVIIQVNSDALLGGAGSRARACSQWLIRSRMAHVIASDAHSPRSRPPMIRRALALAAELDDSSRSNQFAAIAESVIAGKPVRLPNPRPAPRRTLLERLSLWKRS